MLWDFFGPITKLGNALLAEFFSELTLLQSFTSEEQLLVNALNNMKPHFAGIVLNQIEVGRILGRGVDMLRDRPEKRKFLLLFTTTIDRESYRNLEEYQDMFRETDIDLFVISYAPRTMTGLGRTFEEKMNRYFFRKLVSVTGGYAYITGEFTYMDELFTDLKSRLTNSYTIGFYVEPGEKYGEHSVELRVLRDRSKVTHREVIFY
jgi:hypothetical protein